MKFLFLLHGDAEAEAALPAEERMRIVGEHMALRRCCATAAFTFPEKRSTDPRSAAVVRPGENPIVTDGPFAETKEALGGFYVVECAEPRRSARACRQGAAEPRRSPSRC